ncbi:hypothetical protein CC86DRAFT_403527 [Ophiobolus disseminans]|uniref:Uncharacterized protein n=1 Tax=Ophiobolus disseminans TaxID=1469910 RepID=A0A6A7ABI1_9PLEO|nr:hypothetical protein CC86DRAFT_403527 [Ophiobolus disseminans]
MPATENWTAERTQKTKPNEVHKTEHNFGPPQTAADRRFPPNIPKERLWAIEACRQAMSAWVIKRFEAQTQDAINVAEQLVFDMTTGEWTSEANKRYYMAKAIHHYGYSVYDWGIGLGSRKAIKVCYAPSATLQPLPDWLLLGDIEGFPDQLASKSYFVSNYPRGR